MSKQLTALNMSYPIGSLEAYISWANRIPILSVEQEQELAHKLHDNGDLDAARQLILPHLRFVIKIARNYAGYGLPQADLIQEGNIGLMKAVKRFDPNMGIRLVSFAIHWIKAEMHEFILRNWRIVKVATTKAQRKLFFNIRKASKKLKWFSNSETEALASNLNVTTKDVRTMEARMANAEESFEGYSFDDGTENHSIAPINYLTDDSNNPEKLLEKQDISENREILLANALAKLDERSQDILQQRWLSEEKSTLHDLAARYSVSVERIRQLEQQAMLKVKKAIQACS